MLKQIEIRILLTHCIVDRPTKLTFPRLYRSESPTPHTRDRSLFANRVSGLIDSRSYSNGIDSRLCNQNNGRVSLSRLYDYTSLALKRKNK